MAQATGHSRPPGPGAMSLPSASQITHYAGLGHHTVILNPTKEINTNPNNFFALCYELNCILLSPYVGALTLST